MFEADRSLGVNRWPLVRIVPGHGTEVVLLSRRFFEISTHWVSEGKGRSIPCCGDDCRLCELVPIRGLFYAACMWDSRVAILELGAQASSHFEQHCKLLNGGMQAGLVVMLTRRGAKQPVRSEVLRSQTGCVEVSALELATHVMAIFKYPCPNPGDDLEAYERRCRLVAKVRCDRAADLFASARERCSK